jgi:hypothetical protein
MCTGHPKIQQEENFSKCLSYSYSYFYAYVAHFACSYSFLIYRQDSINCGSVSMFVTSMFELLLYTQITYSATSFW